MFVASTMLMIACGCSENELAGYDFLCGVWRKGIDPREVGHQRARMAPDGAGFAVHRDAGKVAHMLVGAGELVEKRGLAAVLIACKRKGERRALRKRMLVGFDMIASALAESRVVSVVNAQRGGGRGGVRVLNGTDADLFRVGQPERQLIAVQPQLHRVAHRGVFHQRDLRTRNHAHIQEMLPQRSFAADGCHNGALPRLKFSQVHPDQPSSTVRRSTPFFSNSSI